MHSEAWKAMCFRIILGWVSSRVHGNNPLHLVRPTLGQLVNGCECIYIYMGSVALKFLCLATDKFHGSFRSWTFHNFTMSFSPITACYFIKGVAELLILSQSLFIKKMQYIKLICVLNLICYVMLICLMSTLD